MTRPNPTRSILFVLAGALALYFALGALGRVLVAVAHADPPAAAAAVHAPAPMSTLQPVPGPVDVAAPAAPAPAAPAPGIPWQAWIVLGFAALSGGETMLRGLRALLGVIAPRTRTTADDNVRDFVAKLDDQALAILRALLGMVPPAETASTTAPTGPRAMKIGTGALLALLIAGAAMQPACATVKAAPTTAGHAIVDCTKADAPAIIVLLAQLGVQAAMAAIELDAIDWPALEAAAWAQGKVVGGCALTEFVAALSAKHPTSQGVLAAPDPGREALARLSARWGGVEWRTAGSEVR